MTDPRGEKPKPCCSYEDSEEMTAHAPLCTRRRAVKRDAYGIVASLIAEARGRLSESVSTPTRDLLRELEAIETTMREASKVTP